MVKPKARRDRGGDGGGADGAGEKPKKAQAAKYLDNKKSQVRRLLSS